MKSRTLRREVLAAVQHTEDAAAIQTHLGGGMHPKSSQLWGYLLAIQNAYGVTGDLMEIGVFKGWGAFLPARFRRADERLVLVDIAAHYLEESKAFLVERTGIDPSAIDLLQVDSVFTAGLERELGGSRRLRFVHIDGEHSYGAVTADLDCAARYALADALIVVDDVDLAHSTCINDGLHDWLARNSAWKLLVRGFNKAYIVSTRTRIPWSRHVEFLPEVFRRFFRSEVMLASQTHSLETPYFAVGDAVGGNAYQLVSNAMASLEAFDAYHPRAALLGRACRPVVGLCGDATMGVLANALRAVTNACGMEVGFEHLGPIEALFDRAGVQNSASLQACAGIVVQPTALASAAVPIDAAIQFHGVPWLLVLPTLRFNGYWPNQVEVQLEPGSERLTAVDALIYNGIDMSRSDLDVLAELSRTDLYRNEDVLAFVRHAVQRIADQEAANHATVRVSAWMAARLAEGGQRLFHAPGSPGRAVMDMVTRAVLRELFAVFEPRHRDRFEEITEGQPIPGYDWRFLAARDEPPLPSVVHALRLAPAHDDVQVCRFLMIGADDAVHQRVTWAAEQQALRARILGLDESQREFNRGRVESALSSMTR